MAVQKMTRIALLAAILYVSKAVLEFLPNVELVSLLVILYTIAFGAEALVIVTVFNGFELLQWGFGTWWVTYLYAYVIMSDCTGVKKSVEGRLYIVGSCVRRLWSYFRLPVCDCLYSDQSFLCIELLDCGTVVGCMACGM